MTEIELMRFVEVATYNVRAGTLAPSEDSHIWWITPIADHATDRDIELAQQELCRRFPNWSIEVSRVSHCGWMTSIELLPD